MTIHEGFWIDVEGLTEQQKCRVRHGVSAVVAKIRSEEEPDTERTGWEAGLGVAMAQLEAEGWTAQIAAIREAADSGGMITRSKVYELAEYESSRSLRGFTRPVRRVCEDLREDGVLPDDAPDLLEAVYQDPTSSYQRASGFTVPDEVVALLSKRESGVPDQVGTAGQRARPWPADGTPGFVTARSRNVHSKLECLKYQHTLDVARKFGRKIHPVVWTTTGEARATGKGICSHCFETAA